MDFPLPRALFPFFSSPGGQVSPVQPNPTHESVPPVLIAIVRYREEPVSPRKKAI